MTAVVVNARFFYPDFLAERQSGPINWQEDPDSLIPYEGLRKCDWSRPAGKCLHGEEYGPFGTGQNCGDSGVAAGSGRCRPVPTVPFEFSTDRGLYGGTYVGLIGGAVAATSVPGVLQFDLNANDRFAPRSFPTALIYNSLASTQKVAMNTSAARRVLGPSASADIYETTTDSVILKGASLASDVTVEVPPGQAIIAVAVPAGSALVRAADGQVSVGETVVRFRTPAKTDDGEGSNTPRVRQPTPPASWPAPTKGLPVYIFGSNERAYDTTDYLTNMTSRFDLAIYGSPHAAMVPPHRPRLEAWAPLRHTTPPCLGSCAPPPAFVARQRPTGPALLDPSRPSTSTSCLRGRRGRRRLARWRCTGFRRWTHRTTRRALRRSRSAPRR